MSLTRTFVLTRAPASLQMRAAATSTERPRLPKTPPCAQAARWWPRESSGRPRRQKRRSWRQKEVETTPQQHLEEVGVDPCEKKMRARPPPEPPWARKRALTCSPKAGKMLRSLCSCSTRLDTSCCHPDRCSPSSKTSGSRRASCSNASHAGTSKPWTPSGGRLMQLPTGSHNQHGDSCKLRTTSSATMR